VNRITNFFAFTNIKGATRKANTKQKTPRSNDRKNPVILCFLDCRDNKITKAKMKQIPKIFTH
jgi:hypothetical protein